MGTPSEPITGPDFEQGIQLSTIPANGMILGHVEGEAVLLIRRSETFHAVGATCPHYGAPLAEGMVVGDELRCPWHHAAFDLATGQASCPSLNPLPCWNVELRNGQVYVRGRKPRSQKLASSHDVNRIVIIGAGAAGNAAAEELRTQGFKGQITLLSADTVTPYDRPNLSKDYLAGRAPEEWIPLRNKEFYRDAGIDIRFGVRAVSLDAKKKIITTSSGETMGFDRCLLATGATPRRISVNGNQLLHVHYLRTLEDCRRIISAADQAKNAVIIGSGFIGLEVAASLRAKGVHVSVVSPDTIPLQKVVGKEIGLLLQKTHEANGVTFFLNRNIDQINSRAIKLDQGELLPADLVVVGIGVSPDIGLAESAGLRLGGGGVEVDSYLQTSVSGIFAAGDLAFWPDARTGERMRVEHWAVAGRQGQAAARNMLGHRAPFRAVPFFWTTQYDTTLAYIGHAPGWDEIRISGRIQDKDATVGFLSHGVVRAVATLGRDKVSLEAEAALESGDNARLLALLKE